MLRGGHALLHDMCELMSEQALTGRAVRFVAAAGEIDVAAVREGLGLYFVVELRGFAISMDAHAAEICAETTFHKVAGLGGQGLSASLLGRQSVFKVRAGGKRAALSDRFGLEFFLIWQRGALQWGDVCGERFGLDHFFIIEFLTL